MSNAPYPTYVAGWNTAGMSSAPYPTEDWGAQPPPQQPPPPYGAPPYSQPPDTDTDHQFTTSLFSDKKVRHGFIRKVYTVLAIQLLLTFAIVCCFTFIAGVKLFVVRHLWLYYVSYAIFLVTYIVLVCIDDCRRRSPMNYIALAIFTLALSYMLGVVAARHDTVTVMIALAMTVILCLAIMCFAMQTRIDFTMCSGLIFALSIVLLLTGLAAMIVYFTTGPSRVMQAVYAGISIIVFSVILIYDTQLVVGGRKHQLDPEEYIYGAMSIYTDVVALAMSMIGIIGAARE